jgi:elongation factor G
MLSGSSKDRFFVCVDIRAKKPSDDKRLQGALSKIAVRDLQISVNSQPQGVFHTVEGQSTLQLDSICNRLRNQYLSIDIDGPKPVFLKTFRESCKAEGKYIRQVSGSGNYGHCLLNIEPRTRGEGYLFISRVSNNALPDQYVSSVDRGVQIATQSGGLHGYPLVDLKVTLIDATYHAENSNLAAFEIAGSTAFQSAVKNTSSILLEPRVRFELDGCGWYMEEIKQEVTRRHGRIEEIGSSGITATLALSEFLVASFREIGAFTMRLAGYEQVCGDAPSDEDASGVTANNPNSPRPWGRFEAARPEDGL